MRTILTGLFVTVFSCALNAQLQSGGSHAGFAVDADTKVGYSKFGPSTATTFNNDDWFLPNAYSGTGIGVIDTNGTSTYLTSLQAKNNISFSLRMSKPMFSVVNNKLWLDAIYARDYSLNYTSGTITGPDSTAFSNSAKNGLNPNSNWQGGAFSFTNKTDLVDGFAHMRRDGTSIHDSLWIFFGVSTLGTNGDRYYDIELFKKQCSYNASTGNFSTAGTEGGHTAWTFDSNGEVTQTGDMIIAVTYSPGTAPVIDMRIWVSPSTYSTVSPYYFKFNGTFDGSGSYGYAQIVSKTGGTAWGSGVGNYNGNLITDTTYSTPWGTSSMITGNNAWSQNYQQLQFTEVGLNLSRIGVDGALYTAQGINPCETTFYSVLFKSRSSSSFTSNLQDFLGPLNFYQPSIPSYTTSSPVLSCNNPTGLISLSNTNSLGNYTWSTSNGNILSSNGDSTQLTINKGGTYYLNTSPYEGCPSMRTDTLVVPQDTFQPVADAWWSTNASLSALKLWGGSSWQPVTIYGGTQGITYNWTGPNGFTSTQQAPVTSFVTGTYQLVLTEARNGCRDTATVWVDLSTLAANDINLSASNNNGKANLQWDTKLTSVNGEFTIEASENSNDFKNIGKAILKPAVNHYTFTDIHYTTNTTYYRIRFTQEDGKIVYSNIVKLSRNDDETAINIIPQKSNSTILINGIKAGSGTVNTVLYSISGQQLASKGAKTSSGNFNIEMNYPAGGSQSVYILAVYIDNKIVSSKKIML